MELQNCVALVSTLFTLFLGSSSDLQLCKHGQETTHILKLNMDSSPISGTTGMCSCHIQLIHNAKLSLYPEVNIPGCSTVVSLSDTSFLFKCVNGYVEKHLPFNRAMMASDELWLFVKSTVQSEAISGYIQIKTTPIDSQFSIMCFEANGNTTQTSTATPERHVSNTTDEKGSIPETSTFPTPESTTETDNDSPSFDSLREDKENGFPVAAVAGGIAGGLLLVLVVIVAVVCVRRRKHESNRPDKEAKISENQGHEKQVNDANIGDVKPQNSYLQENENHVQIENSLYESVDIDNLPHHSQVHLMNSVQSHYASPDELNFENPKARKLEGGETVVASSDLYAVVDKSKKHLERNVTNQNHTASSADVYAVVDKSKKHLERKVTDQNLTASSADVNKPKSTPNRR